MESVVVLKHVLGFLNYVVCDWQNFLDIGFEHIMDTSVNKAVDMDAFHAGARPALFTLPKADRDNLPFFVIFRWGYRFIFTQWRQNFVVVTNV